MNQTSIFHIYAAQRAVKRLLFNLEFSLARWRRALAYGRNTLSSEEAQAIIRDCDDAAGWYPITTLTVDDVMARVRHDIGDHPDLAPYIPSACARVSRKSDVDGEDLAFAIEWAVDEAIQSAKNDGLCIPSHPTPKEFQP
jgi:hypothetical protein